MIVRLLDCLIVVEMLAQSNNLNNPNNLSNSTISSNPTTMKYLRIILFFVLSAMSTLAWAQPDLPSEEVEVIKIFEAQLAESEKVAVLPELPSLDTTMAKQTYDVHPKAIDVDYAAPRLKPITYKSEEEIADAYKVYLKLGGGFPKSVYGEGPSIPCSK